MNNVFFYVSNDYKYNTRQLIDPKKHLSYQMPKKSFEIYEEDFIKTLMDYKMFENGIDVKIFANNIIKKIMYSADIKKEKEQIVITLEGEKSNE